MSGKDERVIKDFPICENCLKDFVFWCYESSLGAYANVYFNRGIWIGMVEPLELMGSVLPVPIYDVPGGGSRMCTLKELNNIGTSDIICDKCHIKASEDIKKLIIKIARHIIISYERDVNERE